MPLHNMKSNGLDLQQWVEKGPLQLHASRIFMFGLETHLLTMYRVIEEFQPGKVERGGIQIHLQAEWCCV